MRLSVSVILVVGALLVAAPARAQTYDPNYPVCLHVFGGFLGERMDCIFVSLDQCAMSASGLPAMCVVNPYYAKPGPSQKRPHKR
jgi:hypothetical protein